MVDTIDLVRYNIYDIASEDYWVVRRKIYTPIITIIDLFDIDDMECNKNCIFNSCLTSLKSSHTESHA